jgi:hypothetical protein
VRTETKPLEEERGETKNNLLNEEMKNVLYFSFFFSCFLDGLNYSFTPCLVILAPGNLVVVLLLTVQQYIPIGKSYLVIKSASPFPLFFS